MEIPHPDLLLTGAVIGAAATTLTWPLRRWLPGADAAVAAAACIWWGTATARIGSPPAGIRTAAWVAALGAVVAAFAIRPAGPRGGIRGGAAAIGWLVAGTVLGAVPDTEAPALWCGAAAPLVAMRVFGVRPHLSADARPILLGAGAAALLGGWPRPSSLVVLAPVVAFLVVPVDRRPTWVAAVGVLWAAVVARTVGVAPDPSAPAVWAVPALTAVLAAVAYRLGAPSGLRDAPSIGPRADDCPA